MMTCFIDGYNPENPHEDDVKVLSLHPPRSLSATLIVACLLLVVWGMLGRCRAVSCFVCRYCVLALAYSFSFFFGRGRAQLLRAVVSERHVDPAAVIPPHTHTHTHTHTICNCPELSGFAIHVVVVNKAASEHVCRQPDCTSCPRLSRVAARERKRERDNVIN